MRTKGCTLKSLSAPRGLSGFAPSKPGNQQPWFTAFQETFGQTPVKKRSGELSSSCGECITFLHMLPCQNKHELLFSALGFQRPGGWGRTAWEVSLYVLYYYIGQDFPWSMLLTSPCPSIPVAVPCPSPTAANAESTP